MVDSHWSVVSIEGGRYELDISLATLEWSSFVALSSVTRVNVLKMTTF